MGGGGSDVSTGCRGFRGRAVGRGRLVRCRLGRPATHAAALAVDRHAFDSWGWAAVWAPSSDSASAFWSVSWLSIAHLSRAGLMSIPSRSSRSSARKASTSATGLPLISSVRRLALAWLIAQPRPVNPTRSTTPSLTAELERDPVAAERVAALEGRGRILDDPEVMGPPIVLEDVVAVQIVHSVLGLCGPPGQSRAFSSGLNLMSPAVRRQSRVGPPEPFVPTSGPPAGPKGERDLEQRRIGRSPPLAGPAAEPRGERARRFRAIRLIPPAAWSANLTTH